MIPLSKFCVHPNKVLTAEASDLGFKAGQIPGEQLYEDACDFGIKIKSDKTGKVFSFYLDDAYMPDFWTYFPTDKKCPVPYVTILND
jgi:hypothetical protein